MQFLAITGSHQSKIYSNEKLEKSDQRHASWKFFLMFTEKRPRFAYGQSYCNRETLCKHSNLMRIVTSSNA